MLAGFQSPKPATSSTAAQKPTGTASAQTTPPTTSGQRAGDPNRGPGGPIWWKDPDIQKQLNLTPKQIAAIQKLWDDTLPQLQTLRTDQTKQEQALDQLIAEGKVGDEMIALHVGMVEENRTQAFMKRTLMLYHMYRVLTPDQNLKMQEINKKMQDMRGRGRGGAHTDGLRHPN